MRLVAQTLTDLYTRCTAIQVKLYLIVIMYM